MLPDAFARSLRNLLLPGVVQAFLGCVVMYIAGWLTLAVVFGWLITHIAFFTGEAQWVVGMFGAVGAGVIAWVLLPLLFPLLMSFFDDAVANAIERHDYPQLPAANPPFWPTVAQDAWFSVKALLLNLLLLPLYLFPGFGLVLFYAVNGWLLGAQFFRMAAGRRTSPEAGKALLAKHRGTVWLAGGMVMLASTIPLLNFAAPVLGVAVLLHVFHALAGNQKQQVLR